MGSHDTTVCISQGSPKGARPSMVLRDLGADMKSFLPVGFGGDPGPSASQQSVHMGQHVHLPGQEELGPCRSTQLPAVGGAAAETWPRGRAQQLWAEGACPCPSPDPRAFLGDTGWLAATPGSAKLQPTCVQSSPRLPLYPLILHKINQKEGDCPSQPPRVWPWQLAVAPVSAHTGCLPRPHLLPVPT